jgi:hypothetical protein
VTIFVPPGVLIVLVASTVTGRGVIVLTTGTRLTTTRPCSYAFTVRITVVVIGPNATVDAGAPKWSSCASAPTRSRTRSKATSSDSGHAVSSTPRGAR